MAKPARAGSSLDHMVEAVGYSAKMLTVAVEMDSELAEEDVAFFRSQGELLDPQVTALDAADTEARRFDRGPGMLAGMRVRFGDMIQDRAVRWGNRLTKAELLHDPGSLGAEHAFGNRVEDLVKTNLELEPEAVLRVVGHLGELPEFSSRERIVTRLTEVATRQQRALDQRVETRREENSMESRRRLETPVTPRRPQFQGSFIRRSLGEGGQTNGDVCPPSPRLRRMSQVIVISVVCPPSPRLRRMSGLSMCPGPSSE